MPSPNMPLIPKRPQRRSRQPPQPSSPQRRLSSPPPTRPSSLAMPRRRLPQQYPAYDYDPYAAREERSGTSPWLILGCFVFFVLVFVCFAGIALVLVDMLNLWCDLPVLSDIVAALGLGC